MHFFVLPIKPPVQSIVIRITQNVISWFQGVTLLLLLRWLNFNPGVCQVCLLENMFWILCVISTLSEDLCTFLSLCTYLLKSLKYLCSSTDWLWLWFIFNYARILNTVLMFFCKSVLVKIFFLRLDSLCRFIQFGVSPCSASRWKHKWYGYTFEYGQVTRKDEIDTLHRFIVCCGNFSSSGRSLRLKKNYTKN